MKLPEEEVETRLPVWDALQMLFMDTDPALFLDQMAETCAHSPYTVDEIEEVLFQEVLPACRFNMFSVAGEWTGFHKEWLQQQILKTHRYGKRRPWLLRRHTESWWKQLKPLILERRSSTGNRE
jgi:hypothetical protein